MRPAVTGSLSLYNLTRSQNAEHEIADFAIAYRTISLSLNVILTFLIIARLLYIRREVGKLLSETTGGRGPRSYMSMVAMLDALASLEAATALVYIVFVGVESPLRDLILPALGQVHFLADEGISIGSEVLTGVDVRLQVISLLLIVYRGFRSQA